MTLLTKINDWLGNLLRKKDLQKAYQELSLGYKNKGQQGFSSVNQAIAYLVARMPATYHAVASVLKRMPESVKPASVLDLGAGPGTASLACLDYWGKNLDITCVESNPHIYQLGQQLFKDVLADYSALWEQVDLLSFMAPKKYDLVCMSYVVGEVEQKKIPDIVAKAWEVCERALIIVLPGTPHDFKRLLMCRDMLIDLGASIVAPCPHHGVCPMQNTSDWCHFSVRFDRSLHHQKTKQASLGFEDEKYCYLIASRISAAGGRGRIVHKPIHRSGHVILDVCEEMGQIKRHVLGRSNALYKSARKKNWGDDI